MNSFENGRQKALNAFKKKEAEQGLIFGRTWEEVQSMQQKTYIPKTVDVSPVGDYGADPLGNGKFKMVPSGDIVDLAEMKRRRGYK